jgi:probable HAF family extracellular repeat protein
VIDLGTLPGDDGSAAAAVNDARVVVGESGNEDQRRSHAVMWDKGQVVDLGTLPAPFDARSMATAVNDSNQVAGVSYDADGNSHAFVWANGVMRDLGTLGGTSSYAESINAAGVVAGWSFTAAGDFRGFIWDGTMHDIPVEGTAINNRGQVVGYDMTAQTGSSAVWWKGTVTPLAGFAPGDQSDGQSINSSGVIGGADDNVFPGGAALWTKGVVSSVNASGPCPGFIGPVVLTVNDPGDILSYWQNPDHGNQFSPLVCDNGVQAFLPSPPNSADSFGNDMDNRADVVGTTNYLNSSGAFLAQHATLWTRA